MLKVLLLSSGGSLNSRSLALRKVDARVAQLVEQRFCKPPVVGSSPSTGFPQLQVVVGQIWTFLEARESIRSIRLVERKQGRLPEWLKGADCKSADYVYIGSNPIPPNISNLSC